MSTRNSMPFHASLADWEARVQTHLPQIPRSYVRVIAWGSFAMVMAQSCGLTSMSVVLAALCGQSPNTLRQRLREFAYAAAAKRGTFRTALDVTTLFPALVRWIVAWWQPDDRRMVLVMDATTLRQTVTVLTISIVYRGCAIPVAWQCVGATVPGAWRPHWERLITTIQPAIPASWTVLVAADRGLYGHWLFQAIVRAGWHPLLRINARGFHRPAADAPWHPLAAVVRHPGDRWMGQTTCFKGQSVPCTRLAAWDAAYADPWLVITDLAPDAATWAWYGMRSWIEQGFKDLKRGGWHWEQTKMTDPERIARWWVLLAVATLWVVSVGGEADRTDAANATGEDEP
ncbi:transposase, partial [Herpetosiphon llansteffanensis]|uniref:transposase n=1 Tax=Herpetosiphon llansteffanensis TaxID=2094568 RepID=UPI00196AAC5D